MIGGILLSQVVEETLRVANVAAMVHRVAIKDVEYGGYTIPQGWRVVVWLRSLHTDPNYYDDPLKFNPDRWEVSSVSPSLHTEHTEHREFLFLENTAGALLVHIRRREASQ